MKAIIGQFYKTEEKAIKRAEEQKKMWKGRCAFYYIKAPNGYLVISESQARICFPEVKFSLKDRAHN